MEKKQAHLQMIQAVINRLSQNSFLLKGWSVILISALFALAANNAKVLFIYLAYFPTIAFWVLDGYFLKQERLFRKLYDHVRDIDENDIDFNMNTGNATDDSGSWIDSMFSTTLILFHGTIFISVLVVMIMVLSIQ